MYERVREVLFEKLTTLCWNLKRCFCYWLIKIEYKFLWICEVTRRWCQELLERTNVEEMEKFSHIFRSVKTIFWGQATISYHILVCFFFPFFRCWDISFVYTWQLTCWMYTTHCFGDISWKKQIPKSGYDIVVRSLRIVLTLIEYARNLFNFLNVDSLWKSLASPSSYFTMFTCQKFQENYILFSSVWGNNKVTFSEFARWSNFLSDSL